MTSSHEFKTFCQNEVNNWKWSHLKNEIIYQLQHLNSFPLMAKTLIWWNVRELFVRWKPQINSSWRISDRHRLIKANVGFVFIFFLIDRPIWYLIHLCFSPDKVTTCIWRNQVQSVCNLSTVFTMGGTVALRSPSQLFMTGELHSVVGVQYSQKTIDRLIVHFRGKVLNSSFIDSSFI